MDAPVIMEADELDVEVIEADEMVAPDRQDEEMISIGMEDIGREAAAKVDGMDILDDDADVEFVENFNRQESNEMEPAGSSDLDVIYNLSIIKPTVVKFNRTYKYIHLGYVEFEKFYIHLVPFHRDTSDELVALNLKLQALGESNTFQRLLRKPICGQVIIAKQRDIFMRALVIKTCAAWTDVVVLMLDHGYTVPIHPENWFQFDLSLSAPQCQALRMRLPFSDFSCASRMGVEIRSDRVKFITFEKQENNIINGKVFTADPSEYEKSKANGVELTVTLIGGGFMVEDYSLSDTCSD